MKNSLFYRFMCWYDGYWRRKHGVEKFDELLSFSFEKFSGKRRVMNDGSWIEPGDWLIILHFNREFFIGSSANPQHSIRNALHFRKLLLSSLGKLAKHIDENEKFKRVKVLHGISWLPPHGERLGFLIEPKPNSIFSFFQALYFKLLLKVFFPHVALSGKKPIQPYAYWLTRRNLLKYFSPDSQENELLIAQK